MEIYNLEYYLNFDFLCITLIDDSIVTCEPWDYDEEDKENFKYEKIRTNIVLVIKDNGYYERFTKGLKLEPFSSRSFTNINIKKIEGFTKEEYIKRFGRKNVIDWDKLVKKFGISD